MKMNKTLSMLTARNVGAAFKPHPKTFVDALRKIGKKPGYFMAFSFTEELFREMTEEGRKIVFDAFGKNFEIRLIDKI